jgi:hypothetical protein
MPAEEKPSGMGVLRAHNMAAKQVWPSLSLRAVAMAAGAQTTKSRNLDYQIRARTRELQKPGRGNPGAQSAEPRTPNLGT